MQGNVTVTPAGAATIHTYTAPETGWRANSHVIELASQVVLFDAPLTQEYTREVLDVAGSLGKPVTRLYISHAHPDHFAGAAAIHAPSYSLGPVKDLIDRSGDLRIQRGYACTPGHSATPPPRSRPVDHAVLPGAEETLDGVPLRFEAVTDAETGTQLIIALPGTGVLISQDVLYNSVHPFLGEHAFDTWQTAITALEALPYETVIPGRGPPHGDGLPSGRAIYTANREYLTAAATAFAEATGPEDLNSRLEAAFPSYGGTAMQGLQNFYLYPQTSTSQIGEPSW
jgi:glyoxylase-like metal-dependent hydrolase (beta-lactamase superfamily II)